MMNDEQFIKYMWIVNYKYLHSYMKNDNGLEKTL